MPPSHGRSLLDRPSHGRPSHGRSLLGRSVLGRRPAQRGAGGVVLALCTALLAAACGGPAAHQDSPPTSAPAAAGGPASYHNGVALDFGTLGAPTNWNPLSVAATAPGSAAVAAVAASVLPSAWVVGPAGSLSLNSSLLSSATEVSASPQTILYRIDSRATWSDGVPVTAADFAYTWQADSGQARFSDVGGRRYTPASTAGYDRIASVAAGAGAGEVVVTFSRPDPQWRALFSPLLPAHIGRKVGFDAGFTNPVTDLPSAGPYMVQSYQPGVAVQLVRNPTWWGPPANLDSLTIRFEASLSTLSAGIVEGQIDAATFDFLPTQVTGFERVGGLSVTPTALGAYDDLAFAGTGPLADVALRAAVAVALDRKKLASAASLAGDTGASPVDNRYLLPGAAGYRAGNANLGASAGRHGVGVASARALLARSGYTLRRGKLTKRGSPVILSLAVSSGSPVAPLEAAAVRSACSALGIRVVAAAAGASADLTIVERQIDVFPLHPSQTAPAAVVAKYLSQAGDVASTRQASALLDRADGAAWRDATDLPLLWVPEVLVAQRRYSNLSISPGPAGVAWDAGQWGIPAT